MYYTIESTFLSLSETEKYSYLKRAGKSFVVVFFLIAGFFFFLLTVSLKGYNQ